MWVGPGVGYVGTAVGYVRWEILSSALPREDFKLRARARVAETAVTSTRAERNKGRCVAAVEADFQKSILF